MQQYVQKRKQNGTPPLSYGQQAAQSVPNSVQLAMAAEQIQQDESVYGDALKAKFMQHQIPSAEREADRIAEGVRAATPEQVKAQLGEKMGADFSDVRFHTDAASAGQAGAIGARAFTTGRDVYFGPGGFDPGVAAHELVHTVQQGSVAAEMGTVSAPAGGVQMKPGNWLTRGAAWLWDKSIGSMKRKHDRAFNDVMRHKSDNIVQVVNPKNNQTEDKNQSSYYDIGKLNRALNFVNNPLAVMRSWFYDKKKWGSEQAKKDADEQQKINAYKQGGGGRVEGDPEYNLIPGQSLYEFATDIPQLIGETGKFGVQDEEGKNSYTAFGIGEHASAGMSILDTLQGVQGLAEGVKGTAKAWKGGLRGEKVKKTAGFIKKLNDLASGVGDVMSWAGGLGKWSEKTKEALNWQDKKLPGGLKIRGKDLNVGKAMGFAGNGLSALQNISDLYGSGSTKWKLMGARKEIGKVQNAGEKQKLGRLAEQARQASSQRMLEGTFGLAGTGLSIGNKFTGGTLKPILSGVKYGLDKVGELATSAHRSSMNSRLLNEEMNLDKAIEDYAETLATQKGKNIDDVGALEYRRLKKQAKHIILKANGFTSGKRSEAAAYFTQKRAKYLADHANDSNTTDVTTAAKKLVKAMRVHRKGSLKEYREKDIAKRLGLGDSSKDIAASRGSNIEGLKARGKGIGNGLKRFGKWLIGL